MLCETVSKREGKAVVLSFTRGKRSRTDRRCGLSIKTNKFCLGLCLWPVMNDFLLFASAIERTWHFCFHQEEHGTSLGMHLEEKLEGLEVCSFLFTSPNLGEALAILVQWRMDHEILWLVPELKVEYNKISAFYPFLRKTKALVVWGPARS